MLLLLLVQVTGAAPGTDITCAGPNSEGYNLTVFTTNSQATTIYQQVSLQHCAHPSMSACHCLLLMLAAPQQPGSGCGLAGERMHLLAQPLPASGVLRPLCC